MPIIIRNDKPKKSHFGYSQLKKSITNKIFIWAAFEKSPIYEEFKVFVKGFDNG